MIMEIVYLCGGINSLSDSDAKDWREAVKTEFADKFEFLDPMRNDYRGRENELGIDSKIVHDDRHDIEDAGIILVNATKPSWGTAMEIFYAHSRGKWIVTVCPSDR